MATKQTGTKEVKEKKPEVDLTAPVVEKEPKKSFDERTQDIQPWVGTEGVDDTRPEPQIEKLKTKKEGKK